MPSSQGKDSSTPVYFILNHDLQEFTREMSDLVGKWKMFPACWTLDVKDYYGKPVRYKGITYVGSPREVYWEYFDPFIKNGIVKIIDKFRDVYDQKGVDVSVAKNEIGWEMTLFIEKFYQKLAVIDQGLIKQSKKDLSSQGVYGLKDVSGMILNMKQFTDRQIEARFHQKKQSRKWFQTLVGIVSIIGVIATIVGVVFAVLSSKVEQKSEPRADSPSDSSVSAVERKNIAKLKIRRLFEDYERFVEGALKGFFAESQALSADSARKNTAESGGHIRAHMDLALKTKVKLELTLQQLERNIEDVLIDGFGKERLSVFADDFQAENKRLEQAKSRLPEIYKILSDSCKSLEVRTINKMDLTKNFDLTEQKKS